MEQVLKSWRTVVKIVYKNGHPKTSKILRTVGKYKYKTAVETIEGSETPVQD